MMLEEEGIKFISKKSISLDEFQWKMDDHDLI